MAGGAGVFRGEMRQAFCSIAEIGVGFDGGGDEGCDVAESGVKRMVEPGEASGRGLFDLHGLVTRLAGFGGMQEVILQLVTGGGFGVAGDTLGPLFHMRSLREIVRLEISGETYDRKQR